MKLKSLYMLACVVGVLECLEFRVAADAGYGRAFGVVTVAVETGYSSVGTSVGYPFSCI